MGSSHLTTGQFFGKIANRASSGGILLSRLSHTQPRKIPPHSHQATFFCLLLSGHYRESFARTTYAYNPLTLVYHPAGMFHDDEIGPAGAQLFSIELPASTLAQFRDYAPAVQSRPDLCGGPAVWLALELHRSLADPPSPLALASLTGELLAATHRLPDPPADSAAPWLLRLRDRLHDSFADSLTLTALAQDSGYHPIHISRTFRRTFRCSIPDYLQRLRVLFVARQLLTLPPVSLASLAAAAGFADQSHLTRTFHRVTGHSPAAWRRLHQSGRNSVHDFSRQTSLLAANT